MIKITYDPVHGIAFADGVVKQWVESVVRDYKNGVDAKQSYVVANDSVINEFRIYVASKEITPADIEFKFDDFIVPVDVEGSFAVTPLGFCDFSSMQALELLGAMLGK
jgi:hypothetical protein